MVHIELLEKLLRAGRFKVIQRIVSLSGFRFPTCQDASQCVYSVAVTVTSFVCIKSPGCTDTHTCQKNGPQAKVKHVTAFLPQQELLRMYKERRQRPSLSLDARMSFIRATLGKHAVL